MKIIGVVAAALAAAVPAGAAIAKNGLELYQDMFRTYVRLTGLYTIAPDPTLERCEEFTPDTRLCRNYQDGIVSFNMIVARGNRVLYNETTTGAGIRWSTRIRFRTLRDENGPTCVPGRYSWRLWMHDPAIRTGYDITRRGTWKLACERGQLVAKR